MRLEEAAKKSPAGSGIIGGSIERGTMNWSVNVDRPTNYTLLWFKVKTLNEGWSPPYDLCYRTRFPHWECIKESRADVLLNI